MDATIVKPSSRDAMNHMNRLTYFIYCTCHAAYAAKSFSPAFEDLLHLADHLVVGEPELEYHAAGSRSVHAAAGIIYGIGEGAAVGGEQLLEALLFRIGQSLEFA